jgi:hypothetical protein
MFDQELFDRIMARCTEQAGPLDTPCMVWTGAISTAGYGQLSVQGRLRSTHRAIYEALHGAIPEGLHCLHRCDVTSCCNPQHLRAGTAKENMQEAARRGRLLPKPGNNKTTLTLHDAQEIRRLYHTTDISQGQLGTLFGVSQSQVGRIIRGKHWIDTPSTDQPEAQ